MSTVSRQPEIVGDSAESPVTRVCVGTSCVLRGADRIREALRAHGPVETVHCLGFCDQSPAIANLSGEVHTRCVPGSLGHTLRRTSPAATASHVRALGTEPIVTRRIGAGDFASLSKAVRDGAYGALDAAVRRPAALVLEAVEASGERGRGGGDYSTGAKWRAAARAPHGPRVAIANGDEGDPGSFVDRLLLERDPHGVLEGLALCAYAIGAGEAIVFIRREYPRAIARMQRAIDDANEIGILGPAVCGSAFSLQVRVERGVGRYVCGEETALLNAVEGLRPEVRVRPPYPAERGLGGLPTVINNVETLVNVPWIVARGADAYAALGTAHSHGTKALCLSAAFEAPGVVEVPFGISLLDVIQDAGATVCDDSALFGVLLGGPMGSLLEVSECDVPVFYGAMAERGIRLGHGGLVALPPEVRLQRLLKSLLHFAHDESCGKCLPCRVGSRRALDLFGEMGIAAAAEIEGLLELMEGTSLCGFGRGIPGPLRTLLARLSNGQLRA